jgi:hypothetical protein
MLPALTLLTAHPCRVGWPRGIRARHIRTTPREEALPEQDMETLRARPVGLHLAIGEGYQVAEVRVGDKDLQAVRQRHLYAVESHSPIVRRRMSRSLKPFWSSAEFAAQEQQGL